MKQKESFTRLVLIWKASFPTRNEPLPHMSWNILHVVMCERRSLRQFPSSRPSNLSGVLSMEAVTLHVKGYVCLMKDPFTWSKPTNHSASLRWGHIWFLFLDVFTVALPMLWLDSSSSSSSPSSSSPPSSSWSAGLSLASSNLNSIAIACVRRCKMETFLDASGCANSEKRHSWWLEGYPSILPVTVCERGFSDLMHIQKAGVPSLQQWRMLFFTPEESIVFFSWPIGAEYSL